MDLRPPPQSFESRPTADGGEGLFRLQDALEARCTGFQGDMDTSSLNLSQTCIRLSSTYLVFFDNVEALYILMLNLIALYKLKLIQEMKIALRINLTKLCGFEAWR
jgi:hypothetical protein